MTMIGKTMLLSVLCAGAATAALAEVEVQWNGEVNSGAVNEGASWIGGVVPVAGETMKFKRLVSGTRDAPNEYVVTFPAGGYTDPSATMLKDLPDNTKVTFDATGTSWTKARTSDQAAWDGNKIFNAEPNSHIFAIENVNANTLFGFTLTNGKISFLRDNVGGDILTLESGTFDMAFLPGTQTATSHQLTLLNSMAYHDGSMVIFKDGTTTYLRNIEYRGQQPGGEVLIEGGEHHVYGGLKIGTSERSTRPFHIAGGTVTLEDNGLIVACNGSDARVGYLLVDGTGTLDTQKANFYPGQDAAGTGYVTIGGEGKVVTKDLKTSNDDADRRSVVLLKDKGSLNTVLGDFTLSNNGGNVSTFTMQDESTLTTKKVVFGNNNGGIVYADFNGGTISCPDGEWCFRCGKGSRAIFNGVTAQINAMTIEGQALADYTNTVEIAGGKITTKQLAVRTASGRNTMLLVSGGELEMVNDQLKVGQNGSSAEGDVGAIYRQTGGRVNMAKEVNLNETQGAYATFELLGGVYCGRNIRGWTGSPYRGGTGKTTFRADGGTLKPTLSYNSGNNQTLIELMPEVRLGAKGLTVDTDGHNSTICALCVNDGEVSGRFVKTGAGNLEIKLTEDSNNAAEAYKSRSLNSEHAITVVNGGTLTLSKRSDCRFGRNMSVLNGAALSLVGDPQKLTVDSLTLGDGSGTGRSTLNIDKGDVIAVGEGGISANHAALSVKGGFSEEGAYPVFTCSGEVADDELDEIVLNDPPADKDWGWEVETDESGVTTCSIVIAPKGTLTSIMTYADGEGKKTGSGLVATILGNGTATDGLKLAHDVTVTVEPDNRLTLAGPLKGDGSIITKTGSGALSVTGDNADFTGGFAANGGILEIEDVAAFGTSSGLAKPVTLKSGTFKFDAGDTADVRPVKLSVQAAEKKIVSIVDVAEDATLTVTDVEHVQGAVAKKGAGTLAFDLPAGTFTFVKGNDFEDDGNAVVLPENGDSPADPAYKALSALTVLEGVMSVRGAGAGQTTFQVSDQVLVGANYVGAAPAVLAISNATFDTMGKHITVGHKLNQAGCLAPALVMRDARLNSNSLLFGRDGASDQVDVVVDLENSTIVDNWKIQFGWDKAAAGVTAKNSWIECYSENGIQIGGLTTATFTGANAGLAATMTTKDGNAAGRLFVYNSSRCNGTMRFEDGARLVTTRGIRFQNNETGRGFMTVAFDGGIYEVRASQAEANCRSRMAQPQNQGFTVEDDGLAVQIASDVNHYITFPIRGEGPLTKTGAGTLYLTESYDLDGDSSEKLLQNTGLTTVAEGTLVLNGSLVAEGAKLAVAEGATLDLAGSTLAAPVSGTGTITNGRLTDGLTLVYGEGAPTFGEGVLGSKLTVDFTGTTAEFNTPYVIGHYTGAAPAGLKVKAVNTGLEAFRAAMICEDGDIRVTLVKSGLLVLIK